MRSRGSPRFGPSGKIICVYGVVEELENQPPISDELRACEAELRAAVEAVPVGVILADAQDGSIFMVNPVAKTIFGNAFFSGQKLTEYPSLGGSDGAGGVLAPDEIPLARAILRSESSEFRQLIYTRADGVQTRLLLSGKPIYSDKDQLIGGLMIARDMGVHT